MQPSRDDFLLVLRPGCAPMLRIDAGPHGSATEVARHGATTIVAHCAAARAAAPGARIEALAEPVEHCLQGVRLRWDGAALTVLRAIDAGTHVFVACNASGVVVGSTLAA